jgi:precorrin-2 dehydrogenase/sirohydrochlorin ferrochelatase
MLLPAVIPSTLLEMRGVEERSRGATRATVASVIMPRTMSTLPVELDLQGREALLVGDGPEVWPKIDRLLEAGATVTVIAEAAPGPELAARAGRIALVVREATDADLAGKAIVFAAPFTTPEGEARARRWHAAAAREGRLFCAIDRPEASTFVNVATVRVEGLTMTFGTGGRSPGVARRIREDLEALFSDPRFGRFLDRLSARRASLPRGPRAARMAEAVRGFAIEARLRFPEWFERGDEP